MRKVILFIASSLDGFIARKDGSVDWLFMDADYGYRKFYSSVDTVVMGRKTYEKARELEEIPFKGKKCYVFTRNRKENKGNVEFVNNPVEFTNNLLKERGKDIWLVGGSDIISLFLDNSLIDEIVLSIHPIILGKGIPLFRSIGKETSLKLFEKVVFKNGLVQLHYRVVRQ